jgi:hypothetical protein
MADNELPAMSITVLVPDARSSARQAATLGALPVVKEVLGAANFLPADGIGKRAIIDDLSLVMGTSLEPGAAVPDHANVDTFDALLRLASALRHYGEASTTSAAEGANRLAAQLENWIQTTSAQPESAQRTRLTELRQRLFGNFPDSLSRLQNAMNPDPAPLKLPDHIKRRWINAQGLHRLAVYPRENINENAALRRFVDGVQTVAPDATDEPVLSIEAGDAVVSAFRQAFASALVVIVALLIVLLRDLRSVILVLAPLALAAALTTGAMSIFGLQFNFANVIALPLLFGIGVDNGIHMIMRARQTSDSKHNPLRTSTARAVWFSSLTTIASFGNLCFSPHAGTASMGVLLSIGIGMTIICTLVVLPALLRTDWWGASRS